MLRFENIIPLGDHCAVSMILQNLNLRNKSYPFDWCVHKNETSESNINLNFKILLELLKTKDCDNAIKKMLNNKISKDNKISGDLLYPHETDNIENTNIKYKRRLERLYNNITNKTSNLYIIITRFNIMDELIFEELYNTLLQYNNSSYFLIFSGVNFNYKKTYSNCIFSTILYDINDFPNFDYSYFRPQIKEQINNFILNNKN
jgi:hypothetical protein